jgi:VWFA-related protein
MAMALTSAAMWPAAAQQSTFSARRDIVLVDVLVTDRTRPVRDLTARDFELLDSGVEQALDVVSFGEFPVSVLLALDSSASITSAQLEHLRGAGRALLANLARDDEAALLTFADAVTLRQSPTSNIAAVREALDAVRAAPASANSGTALVNAVYAALMLPDQGYSRRVLIAFTDGVDTSSWLTAPRVLETARRSDVVAYAVSTGRVAGGSFARDLSEATGGTAIEIGCPADLRTTFLSILAEFRQRYLLSYSPANVPNPGWHPLTVRVKGRRVDVKARTGYLK